MILCDHFQSSWTQTTSLYIPYNESNSQGSNKYADLSATATPMLETNVWLTSMHEYKVVGVQCINSGNAAGVQTAGLTSNVMNNVSKELNNDTFLYFSRI